MPAIRMPAPQKGQILVLAGVLFIALLTMTALVIDGGNAWVQQRSTQNATDAAATAGAGVLARNLYSQGKTDGDVQQAILTTAQANGIDPASVAAFYTTLSGVLLSPPVAVGANPTALPPPSAAGVQVGGTKSFPTYFAGIVGISTISASTSATAIAGWKQVTPNILLPIAMPVTLPECDPMGNLLWPTPPKDYPGPDAAAFVMGLCKSADGNVGWLDWTPTAGGFSEVDQSVQTPNNPVIPLPSWQYITQTGNTNMLAIETDLRAYDGQVVFIPIFDAQCGSDPGDAATTTCTDPPHGAGTWYHIPKVLAYQFCGPQADLVGACGAVTAPDGATRSYTHGAYINGGDSICGTGNGGTGCLVGKFVEFVSEGPVAQGGGGGGTGVEVAAVQLVR